MSAFFLNKPYPYLRNAKRDFITYLFIGAFVAFFLIVFQPFDINSWETEHKVLKLWGFGLISFLVPTLLRLIIPRIVSEKKLEESWTIYKEIFAILLVLTCIALCNLLYGRLLNILPIDPYAFAMAFSCTFLVGIFPVGTHVVLKHNRLLKLSLQQSGVLNQQLERHQNTEKKEVTLSGPLISIPAPPQLHLSAENEKDVIQLAAKDLLFIESADNYSTLVFIAEGVLKKKLLRSSLKRIEGQIPDPSIVRCHRAYIVNLNKIKKVEGNAAGYRLFLSEGDDVIPVSRNYIPELNKHLKDLM